MTACRSEVHVAPGGDGLHMIVAGDEVHTIPAVDGDSVGKSHVIQVHVCPPRARWRDLVAHVFLL